MHKREEDIETDLKEIGQNDVDCIQYVRKGSSPSERGNKWSDCIKFGEFAD
jgi:hypothetical protein